MRIGYARVSTQDQNLDLQIDALNANGCEIIFKEKMSAKIKSRPELLKAFDKMRTGDTLVVWKLDRLGRSLNDLIRLVTKMQEMNVSFLSLNDSINTETATGRFAFNVFACLAEFERDMIRERTNAGISAARARGKNGGRPKGLTKDAKSKAETVKTMYDLNSKSMYKISKDLGISRATAYRYLDYMNGKPTNKSKKAVV